MEQIRDSIVPALLKALEGESNNDIVTGCLMALAKIGESRDGSESLGLADTIAAYLSDPNQEIAETAAVALGVLGGSDDSCLGRLISIATDSSDGRTLCGAPQSPVAQRTRTFAAYGLGLVGARLTGEEHLATRQRIVDVLARGLLPAERESTQDLAAAMVISMGLVPLPPSGDAEVWEPCTIEEVLDAERGVSTLEQQLSLLLAVFDDQRLDRYLRAHVPTALARLVAQMLEDEDVASLRRSSIKEVVVETLLVPLDPRKGAGFEEEVRQSCALALGIVVDSDIDPIDRRAREVLLDVHAHQQRQTKAFGLVALGKIAGREGERVEGRTDDDRFGLARAQIVEHLESRLSRGRSGEEHYAALGIGVLGYELRGTPYRLRGAELLPIRQRLEAEDAASDIGAFAIACGIGGDVGASKALVECIERVDDPTAKGYVALALGILRERGARDVLSDIVLQSEYRPELLRQASIALGLLQDKAAVEMLVDMLGRAESQSSLASLAMALGYVGDTSAVEPLVRLLGDETVTKTARGFAAAALGLVAEKDRLPWNATIAIDLNYRATVPTLNSTDGKGLLNIL
ncbi:MAG: hypothetical protein R3F34_17565 [Planctomycetota bacterium]